jgi:hypothetical protein
MTRDPAHPSRHGAQVELKGDAQEAARGILADSEQGNASALRALEDSAGNLLRDGSVDGADVGYDVILIIGQSNATGQGRFSWATFDPAMEPVDPRVMQWGRTAPYDGLILQANHPLHHHDPAAVGCGLAFAARYLQTAPVARKVLLVPSALSATSMSSWQRTSSDNLSSNGDNLLHDAINRANAAIAAGANNRLTAIIWDQGEADILNGRSGAQYNADLLSLIADLRAGIVGAASVPFLTVPMVPAYWNLSYPSGVLTGSGNAYDIQSKLDAIVNDVPYSGVIPSELRSDLVGMSGADAIHYDAPSQHSIGERLASYALPSALSRHLSAAALPAVVPGDATSVTSSGFTANWTAVNGATSYAVLYRPVGALRWRVRLAGNAVSSSVTGLAASAPYQWVVVAGASSALSSAMSPVSVVTTAAVPVNFVAYASLIKSSAVTLDGSSLVQTALDQSGHGADWMQGSAGSRPSVASVATNGANVPALVLNGSQVLVSTGRLPAAGSYSKMVLFRETTISNGANLMTQADGGTFQSLLFYTSASSPLQACRGNTTAVVTADGPQIANKWYAFFEVYDAAATTITLYRNNVARVSAAGVGPVGTPGLAALTLGNAYSGPYGIVGNILEAGFANTALTSAQVASETSRLAAAYNLTLN